MFFLMFQEFPILEDKFHKFQKFPILCPSAIDLETKQIFHMPSFLILHRKMVGTFNVFKLAK